MKSSELGPVTKVPFQKVHLIRRAWGFKGLGLPISHSRILRLLLLTSLVGTETRSSADPFMWINFQRNGIWIGLCFCKLKPFFIELFWDAPSIFLYTALLPFCGSFLMPLWSFLNRRPLLTMDFVDAKVAPGFKGSYTWSLIEASVCVCRSIMGNCLPEVFQAGSHSKSMVLVGKCVFWASWGLHSRYSVVSSVTWRISWSRITWQPRKEITENDILNMASCNHFSWIQGLVCPKCCLKPMTSSEMSPCPFYPKLISG